jgi:hypothetical protein
MTTITLKLIGLIMILATATSTIRPQETINRPQLANQVRAEFLHAWNGYKKYAWGHDDLKPLSKSFHDWHAEP